MKIRNQVRFSHGAAAIPVGLLAAALAGCAASRPVPEDPPASRDDVTAALHEQLDLVLARRAALADSTDPGAWEERQELTHLADEIALRIVRIDPDADVEALKAKLEQAR